MIDWPKWLDWMVFNVTGPEDEADPAVNGDIDSVNGEEAEDGFDDMPVDCGWEDESDEEDDAEGDEDDE